MQQQYSGAPVLVDRKSQRHSCDKNMLKILPLKRLCCRWLEFAKLVIVLMKKFFYFFKNVLAMFHTGDNKWPWADLSIMKRAVMVTLVCHLLLCLPKHCWILLGIYYNEVYCQVRSYVPDLKMNSAHNINVVRSFINRRVFIRFLITNIQYMPYSHESCNTFCIVYTVKYIF